MATTVKLTHTAALILQAVACGYRYGFDVMNATAIMTASAP